MAPVWHFILKETQPPRGLSEAKPTLSAPNESVADDGCLSLAQNSINRLGHTNDRVKPTDHFALRVTLREQFAGHLLNGDSGEPLFDSI